MRLYRTFGIVPFALATLLSVPMQSQQIARADVPRGLHQDPQWEVIRPHLPDPATASAADLETAADVLRARRFPEDALEYYLFAIKRGGRSAPLYNKIGVVQMELHDYRSARASFKQALSIKKTDARAWNNMGALDYLAQNYVAAITEYKRAINLDKHAAVYRSNLATTYIEQKDYDSARPQLMAALQLDPKIFQTAGTGGTSAHILTAGDRARFCFEMARTYAQRGDVPSMLRYLAMAKEAGFDLAPEMASDSMLMRYRKDPRVIAIEKNSDLLQPTPDVPAAELKPLE